MSNGAAAMASRSTLDDDAWDDLLSFIEERRVIPIVGPELLLVATAGTLYAQSLIDSAQRGAG